MTDKKLRNKLTQLVEQYDDPQDLFKDSVDEFMLMYRLRHNQPELIEYMLKTEYAPGDEEAVDFAKEFLTAESVLHELAVHLYALCEVGLVYQKS